MIEPPVGKWANDGMNTTLVHDRACESNGIRSSKEAGLLDTATTCNSADGRFCKWAQESTPAHM
eukprot:CAMPEP_0206481080 /NCGR_PEP_ID=MMETSP0324_2-20121206/37884_1 /ASSEMBLY_ACC=CAM_ASM_000836 /TAXON_ID=2866 /ORGANISM="Crypthecodinium cohnii, Strain Seligo" /LENGTH=63 /DNA_ID=CAMNT_0053958405 /DNA_START=60 /DNA_END=251 /DNA_ORIENTATION=-